MAVEPELLSNTCLTQQRAAFSGLHVQRPRTEVLGPKQAVLLARLSDWNDTIVRSPAKTVALEYFAIVAAAFPS